MEVLLRCCKDHGNHQPFDYVWNGPPASRNCPKCGNLHGIQTLVRVYLLVKHPDGPIKGANGNYYVAGDRSKKAVQPGVEAWTEVFQAVNNPACMKTKEYQELKEKFEMNQFLQSGGLIVPESFDQPAAVPAQ